MTALFTWINKELRMSQRQNLGGESPPKVGPLVDERRKSESGIPKEPLSQPPKAPGRTSTAATLSSLSNVSGPRVPSEGGLANPVGARVPSEGGIKNPASSKDGPRVPSEGVSNSAGHQSKGPRVPSESGAGNATATKSRGLRVPSENGVVNLSAGQEAIPDNEAIVILPPPSGDEVELQEPGLTYVPVNQTPPQQVNWGQTIGQVVCKYAFDGVPGGYFLWQLFPPQPEPYASMLIGLYAVTAISAMDALRALTQSPHPFENFNWRRPAAYAAGFATVVGVGIGLGNFEIKELPKILPLNNYKLLEFMLNPLTKVAAITLISQAVFGITKFGVNYFLKPQENNYENEKPNLWQGFLEKVTAPIEPIILYEALRGLLISLDKDAPLRNEFFPLLVAAFSEVIGGLNHLVMVPRPLDNLVPRDAWPIQTSDSHIDIENATQSQVKLPPTKRQILAALGGYAVRSGFVITAAGMLTLEVYDWLHNNKDEEKDTTAARLTRLYLIATMAKSAQPLAGALWNGAVKLSGCIPSLWKKPNEATTTPLLRAEDTLEEEQTDTPIYSSK